PRGSLHIYRAKFLWDNVCYERIHVHSFALSPVDVSLSIRFESDFADIFEVRGQQRDRKGRLLDGGVGAASLVLGYQGLDDIERRMRIECSPAPNEMTRGAMIMDFHLEPRQDKNYLISYACETGAEESRPCPY